jgi:hypothetical protein
MVGPRTDRSGEDKGDKGRPRPGILQYVRDVMAGLHPGIGWVIYLALVALIFLMGSLPMWWLL